MDQSNESNIQNRHQTCPTTSLCDRKKVARVSSGVVKVLQSQKCSGCGDQNNPQEKVVTTKTTHKKNSWQHVHKGRGDHKTHKKRSWQHA